jgi:glycosyltransferase involved in cell wall biosynthesis
MSENNYPLISLIVAVYKDIEALDLIVNALKTQTYKNFEVIIVEDNDSELMKDYISQIDGLNIKHTFQPDIGIRKTRSLNNGILASEGEYLIFIDGDCIPYSTFIESHVKLSEPGYIISGRRCNLGPKYSGFLRDKEISALDLERSFIYKFPAITLDCKEGHAEAGFYFKANGFLYATFFKNRKTTKSLVGCNYSCFKSDMLKINGYDEGYGESSVGDDTDLEWRFKALGLKIKSAKNVANMFHLYHDRGSRNEILFSQEIKNMLSNKKKNKFECEKGLKQH